MLSKNRLLVVLGPTASGKSSLAIALAREFVGEIISADSRQVYKGLDIGSGKVAKRERRGVTHHLIDVSAPNSEYNVHHFQTDAARAIRAIQKKGKLPILCGGTGFWIEALLSGQALPRVRPNPLLRAKLQRLGAAELFKMLQEKDPDRALAIDRHNPRRLIRAIEIVEATRKPVPPLTAKSHYDSLILGIALPQEVLFKKIHVRLQKRLRQGMLDEVKGLLASGVSARRLIDLGLEYRYCTLYLEGKLTRPEFEKRLEKEIREYAKRQMTWFRRMEKKYPIRWVKNQQMAKTLIDAFLKK
jgi:tRNA dimethylallyltransferase